VERDTERQAFAKAVAYLNYYPGAKWLSLVAGAASVLVYVALLGILWLFADLMVSRGRLPDSHELTAAQRRQFEEDWSALSPDARKQRLHAVQDPNASEVAAKEIDALDPADYGNRDVYDRLWRAQLGYILRERVGDAAFETVQLQQAGYADYDRGLLSLIVRSHLDGRLLAPVLGKMAAWLPWTWNAAAPLSYLFGLLVTGIVLALSGGLLQLLERDMAARAVIGATTRLRRAVYHHTFRLGTLAFRALGPTEAVTVFTRHVEAVHDALYNRLTVLFREPLKAVLLILFALAVNFWLGLAFLLFAALVWLLAGQIAAYFRAQVRQATNQAGERLTVMRESLMLMRLVKCYLMEPFNQSRVERQLARYARVTLTRYRGEVFYRPLLTFLGLLCGMLLLCVAGLIVLNGQLSVAGVIALSTALISLYRPVESLLESRKYARRGREAAAQLFKFLERRGDVGQVVGAEFLAPMTQQLEFDGVSLREPGGSRMLLEGVTLTIPAGQRVGLIGADDLEKHALVYLIPRLLDPTAGEIRIDQHNLRWVTLDSLRSQIAAVLQNNLVFHDTVANNIGCGDSAYTLPQIIEAAKVAHAHHFIQKLPQGYETPIGELGHPLTVSEQFRIGLARAVLRDPAIIIIEEPEAQLDEDTKSLLDDTMARFLPGRTVIFLPHRISTIRSCDQLFLLHKGRVTASGVHKELLARDQLYRHLHYLEFNEMDE
jgi:ABC-type multidrug transport system fused ATPase/permease subunit